MTKKHPGQVDMFRYLEQQKRLERPLFEYDDDPQPTPAAPIVKATPTPLTESDLPESKPIWTRGRRGANATDE